MSGTMYQSAPNFSEGRRPDVVEALAAAARAVPGATLIDYSADPDHNRCVLTILGEAGPVRAACVAASREAVARIDLRAHSGVHPRAGAVDVLPFVPLWGGEGEKGKGKREKKGLPYFALRDEAVALARAVGDDLAQLGLPVYFYEWSAGEGRRALLPDLRRGGFEAVRDVPLVGALAPDLGPDRAHPTAGIAVVGARGPLVAYNINLDTPDVGTARAVAKTIRRERDTVPELEGVRALGLFLASRNQAQVALNLTRPDRTPLPAVFRFVRAAARALGADASESEIIGAIPRASLGGESPESLLWHACRPGQILENWRQ